MVKNAAILVFLAGIFLMGLVACGQEKNTSQTGHGSPITSGFDSSSNQNQGNGASGTGTTGTGSGSSADEDEDGIADSEEIGFIPYSPEDDEAQEDDVPPQEEWCATGYIACEGY